MSNKEQILNLYYNEHLKQKEIADIVGTSTQYVSKVVRTDSRIKQEKECRKQTNSEKRKIYMHHLKLIGTKYRNSIQKQRNGKNVLKNGKR